MNSGKDSCSAAGIGKPERILPAELESCNSDSAGCFGPADAGRLAAGFLYGALMPLLMAFLEAETREEV